MNDLLPRTRDLGECSAPQSPVGFGQGRHSQASGHLRKNFDSKRGILAIIKCVVGWRDRRGVRRKRHREPRVGADSWLGELRILGKLLRNISLDRRITSSHNPTGGERMKGPMDEEIDSGQEKQEEEDKPRRRLEEFVGHRYPAGISPESSPAEGEPGKAPPESESPDKKKTKRPGKS